ncbi:MAG: hypothetical protein F4W90_10660 [Gammaproteobacteria bacterium]|nr:hypothetical protein [Gammaproteobacteria bacterium]
MTKFAPLFDSPWQGVFYTAGGSLLISDLGTTPGASSTLLYASIPYSGHAWRDVLGYMPVKHVTTYGARQLAMQAMLRARRMVAAEAADHVFGLGITAALRTSRAKRGDHRACVALQTPRKTMAWHIPFEKEALSRLEEERKLADLAFELLLAGLELSSTQQPFEPTEIGECSEATSVLFADAPAIIGEPGLAVMPGAFNPLHDGHQKMRALAEQRLGQRVVYELSVRNVDKPHLDCVDLQERMPLFSSDELILTNQPRFVEKAELLFKKAGGTYVVGADTIQRIDESRYYGSHADRDVAVARLAALGVRFLVFGRSIGNQFITLERLHLGDDLRALCEGINEEDFRIDMSSTQIRAASQRTDS